MLVGPPRPASRAWLPPWFGGMPRKDAEPRWSMPTRCWSTEAWTSARLAVEAERAEIRHHMVDLLDVSETATVAEFQQLARGAINDRRAREVIPIVVGGSALYVRAIVDDFEFPGTDPAVRARLERELVTQGAERLHQRLSDADPLAATRILPGNARRVIRALEVIELTGRSFSAVLPEHRYRLPDVVQIGIAVDRPTLDARIAARVDAMWAAGFVEEVRRLAASGLRNSLTASRALGYRQVLRYIDGEISESRSSRSHHRWHSKVRSPPGVVVPQGWADRLAALRRS